jgi:hypothetical protein
MITKTFEISTREAQKRLSSTIQHKLRIVLKCYTVTNFMINQEQNSFSFNKTNRIRGIVIKDKNLYQGSFVLEKSKHAKEGLEYELTINVGG